MKNKFERDDAPRDAEPDKFEDEVWACAACTSHNLLGTDTCSVCLTKASDADSQASRQKQERHSYGLQQKKEPGPYFHLAVSDVKVRTHAVVLCVFRVTRGHGRHLDTTNVLW